MRLNERIKAMESKASPAQSGLVVVMAGEAVQDAIKRLGISAETRRRGLILVPAKKEPSNV